MYNEPKIIMKNGILVSPSFVGAFFFNYHRHLVVSRQGLSSNDSQIVLTFCSLNLVAPKLAYPKLHKIVYWVSLFLLIGGCQGKPNLL
jgi:hypothetical protein